MHLIQSLDEQIGELTELSGTIRIRTQEYARQMPNVNLCIEHGAHQEILKGVLDYELDFGIVPENTNRHELLFHPILEETIVFAASQTIAQNVKKLGAHILNDQLFISNGTSCLYHTSAIDVLKQAGITVKDALELPSLEMVKQYVGCGKGYALIPEIAIRKELETGELQILSFAPKMTFTHGLITHKNREHSVTSKVLQSAFMDFDHR